MFVAYLVAILLPIIAIQAEDPKPCCYPDQLSGDVYRGSRRMYSFSIDFEEKRILEDWHGFIGTDFVLYDLDKNERFRSRTNNRGCTIYPLKNLGNYAQCMPGDATFVSSHESEDGKTINTFKYTIDGLDVLKAVDSVTCLPHQITKSSGASRRTLVVDYKNVKDQIEDSSVFDKDIEDCHS